MIFKRIIQVSFCLGFAFGQTDIFEKEPGFINIFADTASVPIYLNGDLLGHSPLNNPIPVFEGIYHITHHPPSISDPFLQYSEVDGVKQIFVLSGDTVTVRLNTLLLANRISHVRREYYYTNYIGIGISLLYLWQLWILAN